MIPTELAIGIGSGALNEQVTSSKVQDPKRVPIPEFQLSLVWFCLLIELTKLKKLLL